MEDLILPAASFALLAFLFLVALPFPDRRCPWLAALFADLPKELSESPALAAMQNEFGIALETSGLVAGLETDLLMELSEPGSECEADLRAWRRTGVEACPPGWDWACSSFSANKVLPCGFWK